MHKELVLKGGLAMRAVLGSTRYTKDIDLDAMSWATPERVRGIVRRAVERVVKQPGLIEEPQITEPKQPDMTLRWKVNGKVPGTNRPVTLTVEVSRREWPASFRTKELELSPQFAEGAVRGRVQVLDEQALAVCKVLALTDPKRDAPRDLFDLSVLLETDLENPGELLASQDAARLAEAMDELWAKVENIGYDRAKAEVAPYLPPETAAAVTEEVYGDMQLKVAENVEQWLEKAVEIQKPVDAGRNTGAR